MLCDVENEVGMKVVLDLMITFSNAYSRPSFNKIAVLKFINGTLIVYFWAKPTEDSIMRAVDMWEGLMMQKKCIIEYIEI